MPRPRKKRRCGCSPKVCYFKPQGIPLSELEEVTLLPDELEALKLSSLDNLSQIQSAKKMNISQSTFSRILVKAYRKLAIAIVKGKAISIC